MFSLDYQEVARFLEVFTYLYTSTQVETGADLNTFVLGYSKMF